MLDNSFRTVATVDNNRAGWSAICSARAAPTEPRCACSRRASRLADNSATSAASANPCSRNTTQSTPPSRTKSTSLHNIRNL